jgi:NitT/TauT family transport system substrate-binding protein
MYNLATSSDLAVRRRAAFERFLRAVVRGADFCRDQAGLAQQLVADAVRLDRSRVEEFWPSYRFAVGLHQALLLALEDETRWAIRNGLSPATADHNFLDHLQLGPLRAAAPASVTVIH